MLEHGFGSMRQVLAFMSWYPKATYYLSDLPGKFRMFLAEMTRKYLPHIDINFDWVASDGLPVSYTVEMFHYINSGEVLEHCPHPCDILWAVGHRLKLNGVLHMSTFFNDCDGEDVSHLLRNNKYQDFDLWLKEGVYPAGLREYGKDPRGVVKLFEKVEV